MSDKGININAAKDMITKIRIYDDSITNNFNTFNKILSNANGNYSSNNRSLFADRQKAILSNFSKLKNLNKQYIYVLENNIIKYTNTQQDVKDILDR